MKKRISLFLCVIAAMLSFTACASTDETVEYDEASVEQATEFLIEYCVNADEATIEQWKGMSDFSMELQLVQAGLPFTPESFVGALDAWESAVEECGEYVSHGDYIYEAAKDGVTVSTNAEFQNRNATISFMFDEQMYLESMTVDAKYALNEILEKAGLNTVLGMGTVFVVLIFISLIISLFKYIPALENALKRQPKTENRAVEKAEPAPQPAAEAATDNTELIAVISAAIAAAEGTSTDGFIVRSIRRRPSNKWNS